MGAFEAGGLTEQAAIQSRFATVAHQTASAREVITEATDIPDTERFRAGPLLQDQAPFPGPWSAWLSSPTQSGSRS
jgi:hypothetical protein